MPNSCAKSHAFRGAEHSDDEAVGRLAPRSFNYRQPNDIGSTNELHWLACAERVSPSSSNMNELASTMANSSLLRQSDEFVGACHDMGGE